MKKIFILLLVICIFISVKAQDSLSTSQAAPIEKVNFGLGLGLDYGGLGLNLTGYITDNFGLFAGLGYNFVDAGFNGGLKYRFLPKGSASQTRPYILGMYGYNAVVKVIDAESLNKIFYGPTFGFGIDRKSNPYRSTMWSIALLIPIRSSEVDDYFTDLENNHGVEFKNRLIPIAISLGVRF